VASFIYQEGDTGAGHTRGSLQTGGIGQKESSLTLKRPRLYGRKRHSGRKSFCSGYEGIPEEDSRGKKTESKELTNKAGNIEI